MPESIPGSLPGSVEDRVKRALLKHANAAGRIGVAVSGGADSVCLLRILHQLVEVSVLHLNHNLRGEESQADEVFVRTLAERLNAPFHTRRVDVRALGGNLEEQARRARYDFFRETIAAGLVTSVATGHTQSDQAETVLFRLLRGSHLAGLSAIHPVAPGPIFRPLLDVSRTEVLQYLNAGNQSWREDSSNGDLSFDRNRIRHALVPQLKREWNPELERALSQMAALAFDEERFWTDWLAQHAHQYLEFRGNIVLASASKLAEQPAAVARRLVRHAIEHVKGNLHAIDFGHVEAILALARRKQGDGRVQPPQIDVYRSFDWVRFGMQSGDDQSEVRAQSATCTIPGETVLSLADVAVTLEVIDYKELDSPAEASGESARVKEYQLDWERVEELGGQLLLRTWKPGDQYVRAGAESPCKVKIMFQDGRIPLWERGTWPMITVASRIIWSRDFGPAADVAAHRESRRLLLIRDRIAPK